MIDVKGLLAGCGIDGYRLISIVAVFDKSIQWLILYILSFNVKNNYIVLWGLTVANSVWQFQLLSLDIHLASVVYSQCWKASNPLHTY